MGFLAYGVGWMEVSVNFLWTLCALYYPKLTIAFVFFYC